MPEVRIIITKHAKEKMVICGITKEQIKIALMQGARSPQTDGYLASYGYIKIAYKKIDGLYKIKTVFVE